MDSFIIPGASGAGSIEFFERTPADARRPIERFKVRVADLELSAVGRVYAGDADWHPASLFARMAANPTGWPDELVWESQEGEMGLRCSMNRNGHVFLRVSLRSGPTRRDWSVEATVTAEAGQLGDLARRAADFFGNEGERAKYQVEGKIAR
jgi:hypothetical protein